MADIKFLKLLILLLFCLFSSASSQNSTDGHQNSTEIPTTMVGDMSTMVPLSAGIPLSTEPTMSASTLPSDTAKLETTEIPVSTMATESVSSSIRSTIKAETEAPSNPDGTAPQVNTTLGLLSGVVRDVGDGKVNAYLGVPYALPPTGHLRFAKPQPAEPWSGVFKADQNGTACPQPTTPIAESSENEDCLTLNVFVPQTNTDEPMPIVIVIPGGGFVFLPPDRNFGQNLAAAGNVIVVGVYYRSGLFGFLNTNDDCARGNWGLWDQHLAIQWVKENAERFGGDPNHITLMGKSSGANGVLYQAVSSVNRDKPFQRLILQSPFDFNFRSSDVVSGSELTYDLAENLGFNGEMTDSSSLIQFLRNQSVSDLIQEFGSLLRTNPNRFYPVTDGEFVSESDLAQLPNKIKEFDLLLGFNSGDHSVLYSGQSDLSRTEYFDYIATNIDKVCRDYGACNNKDGAVQAAAFAYSNVETLKNGTLNLINAMNINLDLAFASFASHLARQGVGKNTYAYEFTYDNSEVALEQAPRHIIPSPNHIEDLFYVNGRVPQDNPEQTALSHEFMAYWTNFIRNGDPNIGNTNYISSNPEWPKFDQSTHSYMILEPNATVGQHFASEPYDFWYGYIRELLEEGEESDEDRETCVTDAGVPVWETLAMPETAVYELTDLGLASGTILHVSNALGAPDKVNVINGIPYAKPPTGSLRFAPPEEAEPWEGILDGISSAPSCPESNSEEWDEDCLTLDVTFVNSSKPLPVIVFIGGHNFQSGGMVPTAENLAVGTKSVVVTLRYRVGALGFLSTEDKSAPGNYGLEDIIAVLEWVNKNIDKAPFDGDPNEVTVLGYGTGGSIVNLLFYSKLSEGLFQHAVSLGGTAASRSLHISVNPTEQAILLGEKIGCRGSNEELITCLRSENTSVSDILSASASLQMPFLPVVDSDVFESSIENLMQESTYPTKPVDYLIGIMSDQEAVRVVMDDIDSCPSEAQFRRQVNSIIGMYMNDSNMFRRNIASAVVSEYLDNLPSPKDDEPCPLLDRYLDFLQDFFVIIPTLQTANAHVTAGGSVYIYNFNQSPKYRTNHTSHLPASVGPALGDDIQYLFGWPYSQDAPGCYGPDDRETTILLMRILHKFIDSGNPWELIDLKDKEWPAYDMDSKQYLKVEACPSISHGLGSESRLRFWNQIIPLLLQQPPPPPEEPCMVNEGLGVTLTVSEAATLIQILIGIIIAILVLYLIICGACCGQRKQLSEGRKHTYNIEHDIPGGWRPMSEESSDML